MFKRLFLSVATLLCALSFATAQQLPNDPAVKVGKLDNGMTYYIRHNDKPAQRAEFYLVSHVGAIQENPSQDGLAHFLEHMCFNGTKNFPDKGILNWLESIGASFGGNVNASTGTQQTIYLLNNIPLVRPTVVDTCLLIMHDYSHFVNCDPEEIDKERGVILEEKRSRNDASWRVREKAMPYIYGDTKLATCTIIGSEENLKTFRPETLVDFYHTWYRPDVQALVVVGDVDVDEVETKIKSTFADIPAPENPKAKDVIKIPGNTEPLVGIITDPELTTTQYTMYWKSDVEPELKGTIMGYMTDLLKEVIAGVMEERFGDISAKPDAPFLGAGFGFGETCETCEVALAQVACKDGMSLEGFTALLTEVEKMKRFGFTADEVERAKTNILSGLEMAEKRADSRKNSEFVMPLIQNFISGDEYMEPAVEHQVAQQILGSISADIINQILPQLITKENLVILYNAPEREGLNHPSQEDILSALSAAEGAEMQQAAGEEIPSELLDASALKGSPAKSAGEGLYGSEVYTLKNGVKVVLLPRDQEKDRISFKLYKKGGLSLVNDEDMYSFESNIWTLYQSNTGIADYSATVLSKMLTGKQASATPYISSYTHGVNGSATRKDLETAFQLCYLYFTAPRFDQDEYNTGINQLRTVLPNMENTPNFKLQAEVMKTAYDSPRKFSINSEVLDKASLKTIEKNYRSLFTDVAGATLIVVGDFDKAELLPLIEKYVGALPKGKKATEASYRGDGIASGIRTSDFKTAMQTPMVTVARIYSSDEAYTVEKEVNYGALEYILQMLYTETLREDEGGTYGASTASAVQEEPANKALLQVVFQTNVESADKLRELASKGLQEIAENGPRPEMFDKTIKNLEKTLPEKHLSNGYWSSALQSRELYGMDFDAEYQAAIKSLTPEKVKACAKALLESGNFAEIVMRPTE